MVWNFLKKSVLHIDLLEITEKIYIYIYYIYSLWKINVNQWYYRAFSRHNILKMLLENLRVEHVNIYIYIYIYLYMCVYVFIYIYGRANGIYNPKKLQHMDSLSLLTRCSRAYLDHGCRLDGCSFRIAHPWRNSIILTKFHQREIKQNITKRYL